MAYAVILDERRKGGDSFEDAVRGLTQWAASVGGVDTRTAEEMEAQRIALEEEQVARANAAAIGMFDDILGAEVMSG